MWLSHSSPCDVTTSLSCDCPKLSKQRGALLHRCMIICPCSKGQMHVPVGCSAGVAALPSFCCSFCRSEACFFPGSVRPAVQSVSCRPFFRIAARGSRGTGDGASPESCRKYAKLRIQRFSDRLKYICRHTECICGNTVCDARAQSAPPCCTVQGDGAQSSRTRFCGILQVEPRGLCFLSRRPTQRWLWFRQLSCCKARQLPYQKHCRDNGFAGLHGQTSQLQ